MSEETLQSAIKNVQEALSKYVKKPPLSEKFLKKPPFRYLHDIINAVIRETGFLEGLYTAEELDSNNVKDKESKIAFLNKLISAVKTKSGKNVTARPAKIVAGLEVVKTLELLQIIGLSIDNKNESNSVQVDTDISDDRSKITKTQKANKTVPHDGKEEKPKGNIPNGHKKSETKFEKVDKVDKASKSDKEFKMIEKVDKSNKNDKTSESAEKVYKPNKSDKVPESKQKRDVVAEGADKHNRTAGTVLSRRESFKKEQRPTAPSSQKDSEARSETSKASKEDKISSRRPSIQNTTSKSVPARKSSLKDSNRSVINANKKLQSVVIKEEREEPTASKTSLQSKQSNKSKVDVQHSNSMKITENNESSHAKLTIDQSVNNNESTNTTKSDVSEKQNDDVKSDAKRQKETLTIQRPGSARPGSRKVLSDAANNIAENKVAAQNSSAANNSEKVKSQTPVRPRTANRPPSARPGAPKLRDRGEVMVPEETATITAPVNVIEEGTQDQFADDKDTIVLIESEQTSAPLQEQVQINDAEQGQLVHQILKTQKELNDSVAADISQNRHLEIEWETGRQREKDIVTKEIEKIRGVIQILTSAANPLGKLIDFLQEDVDEMQRELQHWKNVNEKLQKQQQTESEFKKQSLQPLRKQLQDIETSIEEEYRQIANIKATIIANDDKILKIVTGPASHHQTKTRRASSRIKD